jgi:folate-binding protein YgfZ
LTGEFRLDNRGVVRVAGADSAHFLQNLVTNDVEGLEVGEVRFAALLTPQGKILFDFLIHRGTENEFLLDVAAEQTAALAKRLALYRLRAKIEISDESARLAVVVAPAGEPADPRAALGARRIGTRAEAPAPSGEALADYEARLVALGVPQGGKDFAYGDAFPHDVNMDLLNGVDFRKGCYVGQEVVSRMRHRGEIRRRVVRVAALDAPLETGAAVLDGKLAVGTVGTVAGGEALALMRVDRADDAERDGRPLTAGGRLLRQIR